MGAQWRGVNFASNSHYPLKPRPGVCVCVNSPSSREPRPLLGRFFRTRSVYKPDSLEVCFCAFEEVVRVMRAEKRRTFFKSRPTLNLHGPLLRLPHRSRVCSEHLGDVPKR